MKNTSDSSPPEKTVLWVVAPLLTTRRGTERVLVEELLYLTHEEGWEIHIFYGKIEPSFTRKWEEEKGSSPAYFHRLPYLPSLPFLLPFLLWFITTSLALVFYKIVLPPPDLIFSPGINTVKADAIFLHVSFTKLRKTLKDISREFSSHFHPHLSPLRYLFRQFRYISFSFLEKRIVPKTPFIATISTQLKEDLLSFHLAKREPQVILPGVGKEFFIQNKEKGDISLFPTLPEKTSGTIEPLYLLWIGNDFFGKGLFYALSALPYLQSFNPYLLVVGDDDCSPFLPWIYSHNLKNRVEFFPTREDPEKFFSIAHFYLAPTREDSFGLPILESMASSVIPILSPYAGAKEIFSGKLQICILKPPISGEEIGKKILFFLENKDLMEEIRNLCREVARDLTWKNHGEIFSRWLKESVKEKISKKVVK